MKKLFYLAGVTLIFASCNQNTERKEIKLDSTITETPIVNDTSSAKKPEITDEESCYRFTQGKDVYSISFIKKDDNTISGTAHYDNYQKDDSKGTVKGNFIPESNLLHLWYDFESEGMKSVRELYFKIDGDVLYPGFGAERQSNDSAYIKDPSKLDFNKQYQYKKIACE